MLIYTLLLKCDYTNTVSYTHLDVYKRQVLSQIEACLNSRPLFAISSDVNDPVPLTPGHFLICAPLTAIPDPDLSHIPISRLGRWQLLQKFVQVIWKA